MVVALLAILAIFSFGNYRNFAKNAELDFTTKNIAYDLRNVRAKAMGGESRLSWGIHFVNNSGDYYELFSTPTNYSDASKTIAITVYLRGSLYFSQPAASSTLDVIFTRISGTSTSSTVSVVSEGTAKNVNVTSLGNVYY